MGCHWEVIRRMEEEVGGENSLLWAKSAVTGRWINGAVTSFVDDGA